MTAKKHVVVLGAGVIGLSTAVHLLETKRDVYDVTIIADALPSDDRKSGLAHYASLWAGAQHVSFASLEDTLQQQLDRATFKRMWEMSDPSTATASLFMRLKQTEYYRSVPSDVAEGKAALDFMPDFRYLKEEELAGKGAKAGLEFTTVTISLSTRSVRSAAPTTTSTVSVLGTCCQTIRQLVTSIPTHSVSPRDELDILQLTLDVHKIGIWAQTALLALRAPEKATSPAASQPPPEAPVSTHPTPTATDATPTTDTEHPPTKDTAANLTPPASSVAPVPTVPPTPPDPDPLPPPPERVTIRLSRPTSPRDRPPNDTVVYSLNRVLDAEVIAAVSYSRQGHLVVHLKAPHTAARIQASAYRVYSKCNDLFRLRDVPGVAIEPRQSWTKIVLHRVPFPEWQVRWHPEPTWEEAIKKLRTELITQNKIDPAVIRDIRPLCRASDHTALIRKKLDPHVAIQLSLSDSATASRILRDGVLAHFEHCRASPYRPRTGAPVAARSPTLTVS